MVAGTRHQARLYPGREKRDEIKKRTESDLLEEILLLIREQRREAKPISAARFEDTATVAEDIVEAIHSFGTEYGRFKLVTLSPTINGSLALFSDFESGSRLSLNISSGTLDEPELLRKLLSNFLTTRISAVRGSPSAE